MDTSKFIELYRFNDELIATRAAAQGSAAVKALGKTLLPNPATVTYTDSDKKKKQDDDYKAYLLNAEFDEFTAQTETTMIGKLELDKATIEVDSKLEYLKSNADGDGLSLTNGLLNSAASNVLQAKFHIVVADYQGLANLDVDNVSIAEANQAKESARVVFKQYPRESLIKYNASTVNGVRQVDFMMLREVGYTFDKATGQRDEVESFLVLYLEDGIYKQKKIVKGAGAEVSESEPVEMPAFNFIPFWVFCDEELSAGDFPQKMGFLGRIADTCLHRYRLSADFKDYLKNMPPTNYIGVGDSFDMDVFEKINGTKQIAIGGNNVFPTDTFSVQSSAAGGDLNAFFQKFEESKAKLRDFGATMPGSDAEETATKTRANLAQQTAVLKPLAANLIEGTKALMYYAGIFEGAYSLDNQEDSKESITVAINTDFDTVSLNGQEMNYVVQAQALGKDALLTNDEMSIRKLHEEGFYPADMSLDDVMASLSNGIEQ